MCAPVAQPALPRPPVAGDDGALDRPPERVDLPLRGEQVGLVRLVPHDLAVAQVDELEQPRHCPPGAPEHERVELHLEQRPCLVVDAGGGAGLIVDDPDLTGAGYVKPVDIAPEPEPGRQHGLDGELAVRGLEPGRVFQGEVAIQHAARLIQPGGTLGVVVEQRAQLGLQGRQPLPFRLHQAAGGLRGAAGGRLVEQALEHGMHERPAGCRRARRLRQPVDDPEPVQQRAGQEVRRPRRRQAPARRLVIAAPGIAGHLCCFAAHAQETRGERRQLRPFAVAHWAADGVRARSIRAWQALRQKAGRGRLSRPRRIRRRARPAIRGVIAGWA